MPEMNYINAINNALHLAMKKNKKVIVLGEDVGIDGGVFRATKGLFKKFKGRVIDTPLSESGFIGMSIGLAISGFHPIVEIQFSGFMYSAFEQIVSHAARIRYRSRGRFNCPMIIRLPCSGNVKALEHHQESMESFLVHTPGIKVIMPSSPKDAKGLLLAALKEKDPVAFYEPKRLYRLVKEEVPAKYYEIEIGKAKKVKEGKDISLITYGTMVLECMQAAKELEKQGISCEIIDLRTLSPLDLQTIIDSVKKTGRIIIVHEAPRTLGMGAEISALINEKAILYLKAPIKRITGFDTVNPLSKLEKYYLPNAKKIIFTAEDLMEEY